ncbi:CARDB domain-containing protein [Nonomuraea dietziae]|uniref:CARDB domain-containing protein n=1 Tax=Nonomuraea dietziae TaxID=65515 RepID=UPI0033D434E3
MGFRRFRRVRRGTRTSLAFAAILALLLASIPTLATPAAAAAPGIKLTFKIEYLRQIEDPDSGGLGDGDYFPKVQIADGPLRTGPRIEDDEFEPFGLPEAPNGWTFTHENLPGDKPTVDITVTLWDWDDGLNTNEDRMDISPNDQDLELNLVYDLRSGTLSGDKIVFGTPCTKSNGQTAKGETCVEGDGDHGFPRNNDGRITRIGITATAEMPDTDLDGIPDLIELSGIRNRAGDVIADLPALGADPCRRTIILQLDFMVDNNATTRHSHQPKPGAITLARNMLDAAPLPAAHPCPYPGTHRNGIDFIYLQGAQLAEQAQMSLNSNDYRNARNTNFPAELARYAHYGIFGHDLHSAPGTSGQCCEPNRDNNKDFIVTLGSWRTMCVVDFTRDYGGDDTLQTTAAGDDVTSGTQIHVGDNRRCDTTSAHSTDVQVLSPGTGDVDAKVGTDQDQAGTILHELFHAMALRHGGDNNDNYKPNYLSVMNYFFQTGIPSSPPPLLVNQLRDWKVGAVRLGLSNGRLPQLNEGGLNESAGISDGTDWTFWWTDNIANPGSGFRPLRAGAGNGPLNWNDNRTTGTNVPIIDTNNVMVDINAENGLTTLRDHDDWPAIKFRAQSPDRLGWACSSWPAASPTCAGAGGGVEKELAFDTVIRQEMSFFAFYDPDIATKKTVDKADAEPGDTLTYQVKLDNIGTGQATAIVVKDTPPTGDAQTRQVGQLGAGGATTETFTYVIPCNTADAAVLTNKAEVTAKDLAGGAEANTDNNTATADTKVHAPRLTLDKRATATVNAGEAITVDLKIANVGSAKATGVVLTDTLPKEVYYSQALDQGTGPHPTEVTRNADGTTTLTWSLGEMAANADRSVQFTARPSLLFTAGAKLTDQAAVTYGNAHGCTYEPVTATATTTITEVTPTRDPRSHGYWKTHPEARTAELLARVQATYQQFDSSGNGALDNSEAGAVLSAGGPQPGPAKFQLLATLFDLAARQINASTQIDSKLTRKLGTRTIGEAVRYGFATLALPVNSSTAQRYSDATTLLDEIVNNKSEVY